MGAFLDKPVTIKASETLTGNNLLCGVSSMQGWRATQEDSYNTILEYDKNTSLFAIYDGHGGPEVAHYCSQHLPNYIKQTQAYKNGDFEEALKTAFLELDATIKKPDVVAELKEISERKKEENKKFNESLNRKPFMREGGPNQFARGGMDPMQEGINQKPFMQGGDQNRFAGRTMDAMREGMNRRPSNFMQVGDPNPFAGRGMDGMREGLNGNKLNFMMEGDFNEFASKGMDAVREGLKNQINFMKSRGGNITFGMMKFGNEDEGEDGGNPFFNSSNEPGEPRLTFDNKSGGNTEVETNDDDGFITGQPLQTSGMFENRVLNADEESESTDIVPESQRTYEEQTSVNGGREENQGPRWFENLDPGYASGCTAVVALLAGSELFVANAGDSRCVVCRDGQAVDMSVDHKPEDKLERDRIQAAGGFISPDARVNGNLNLSRAFGNHVYKQNQDLPASEQIITAMPDVKRLTIDPAKDQFMVLASDGIWNSMSSQEVVDFVRDRLPTAEKSSAICEQIFDYCLAPDIHAEVGLDNMTCIIVNFNALATASNTNSAEQAEV